MACNPQVHVGYNTNVSLYYNQQTSNLCLYPLEEATARTALMQADCMTQFPNGARVCALPIAITDSVCALPVLLLDTVWSVVGTIFSGITSLTTCCLWNKAKHVTKDFAIATARNIGGIFCNVCVGPVVCISGSYASYKSPIFSGKLFCYSLANAFCIYPITCTYGFFNTCKDPEETGKAMREKLTQIYDV